MLATWATVAAPGKRANEDGAFRTGNLVGVLDGVTQPAGMETGCRHGSGWYVRRLVARLVSEETTGAPLADILAAAIASVRTAHGANCDPDHPGSPAATVCLVRRRDDEVEYLILGDSPLLHDDGEDVAVVTDERYLAAVADLRAEIMRSPEPVGSPAHSAVVRRVVTRQRERTNRPDGYWIAAADPGAAAHAVQGRIACRQVVLLTDGAFDPLRRVGVPARAILDAAETFGPAEVIRRARAVATGGPGFKRHDDATVLYCRPGEECP